MNEKLLIGLSSHALVIPQSNEDRAADYDSENMKLVNVHAQKTLSREDVYIKSMWLANDIIDSYYSRFNSKTLRTLADKIVGQSVLVGHNKGSLPIGRFFKAQVVRREDGHEWLRAWFYWPKEMKFAEGFTSEDLLTGIETGVYREVSISWTYKKAICSICNQDIRTCEHIPGKEYAVEGKVRLCWYETDDIQDVLEGSFVYKGGQHGTSIANESRAEMAGERDKIIRKIAVGELASDKNDQQGRALFNFIRPLKPAKGASITNEIFDLKDFPKELMDKGEYFIEPKYSGIRCQIHKSGDRVVIYSGSGKELQARLPMIVGEIKASAIDNCILDGELIRRRGHSRLAYNDVVQFLNSKETNDFSMYVKVWDLMFLGEQDLMDEPLLERRVKLEESFKDTPHVSVVRYTRASGRAVLSAMTNNASKEGCVVKDLTSTYRQPSKIWKWKRFAELDVIVIGKESVSGGFVYECGAGSRENPVSLGKTMTTRLQAAAGNILRVKIAHVVKKDNKYRWIEPTAPELREDKENPDPLATVEKLLRERMLNRAAGGQGCPDCRPVEGQYDRAELELGNRAKWTTAFINSLPNSSFAVVERAYGSEKCRNKNARHLPFKDKNGKVDLPHYRNALARVNQIKPVCKGESASQLIARARRTLARYSSVLKGKKFFNLYKAWEGKQVFHQLFLDDGRWLRLPASIANSMFVKPLAAVEYRRSRQVDCGEYSVESEGKEVRFNGQLLNGEFRFYAVNMKGENYFLVEKQ